MRSWILAGLALAVVAGCREDKTQPSPGMPSSATRRVEVPSPNRRVREAITKAIGFVAPLKESLGAGTPDRQAYRALRRHVFATKPFFQLRAQVGSEVLVGPLRSTSEAGGALGMLDAALAAGDHDEASQQLEQVHRALKLVDHELAINALPLGDVAEAISDAAYELGLMAMEAYPGVPDRGEAVREDMIGTTLAILRGGEVLEQAGGDGAAHVALRNATLDLEKRLLTVESNHALTDRASFVRRTGELGVLARRLAKSAGVDAKLPHEARFPRQDNTLEEPVHAFVLPAPRRDLRKGDREAMVALGRRLFLDDRLSDGGARACSDCHQPKKGYTDGRPTPRSLSREPIERNTPTLLYTSIHAAQLWDGLFASAEHQALKVIHTASEMGMEKNTLVAKLKADEGYVEGFSAAFPDGLTADNVGRALVAFEIARLVPGQAPIDRFARGDDRALSVGMRKGLDVFGGVGRCGRCHLPPLFGGSRPPDFSVPVFANLGVLKQPKGTELDDDPGRGEITHSPLDNRAFKTPTVRNVHLTAPFMHHGAYPTLESVIDFYDVGGGRGRGVEVPNQDPDVRKLELADPQKRALTTFLRSGLADPEIPEP